MLLARSRPCDRLLQALLLAFAFTLSACQRGWRDRAVPPQQPPAPNLVQGPGQGAALFAQSVLGKPYCWGGKGPSCYDCSGLTYTAWRSAGVNIPRTSSAQHAKLPVVSMAQLQPGDILWRPGHVGIYIGNGWAIHAPQRGKPVQYQAAHKYRAAHRP